MAQSSEAPFAQPIARRLLGSDIVLWRDSNSLHVWQDLCIHRGAKLSLGTVRNSQDSTIKGTCNRGRPWHETRAVLNGVFWVLGTGAQWRELPEKYPPFQTCHRRFQQWIRSGKLEEALRLLARLLYEQGKLNLEEAFVDATFASAKKGALLSGPRAGARERRLSLSPLATVFLSPYLSRALRLPSASLLKKFLPEAFSMNSQLG